jgi:Secretion system C-terminal sorting domain
MKRAFYLFLCCQFIGLPAAFSTTIVPFPHLGELARHSEAVVVVKAMHHTQAISGRSTFKEGHFTIEAVIKEPVSASEQIAVRPYSHKTGNRTVHIAGDFQPELGRTYLLFLDRVQDVWKSGTLSYYVLEEKTMGLERFWVPVETALTVAVAPRADGTTPEPLGVYRREELIRLLRDFLETPNRVWDAGSARTALELRDFVSERAVPEGCDFTLSSGGLTRWFNDAVQVYYEPTNAPGNAGSILSGAVDALNNNYLGIDPEAMGSLIYPNTCSGGSAANFDFSDYLFANINGGISALVMFEDPCNEIPDLTIDAGVCAGPLAMGGSFEYTPTVTYDGLEWQQAGEGFVFFNENVTTCNNVDMVQLLTHELTHVYRMDHLDPVSYPGQNMNEICCNPVGSKDIQCMNYAYLSPLPVELVRFEAEKWRNSQARLTWATASEKNNDYFFVERSADGARFERVATLKGKNAAEGARYEWIDERPFRDQNYYRLNQVDFDGSRQNHGIRSVRIGDARGGIEVFPNPLTDGTVKIITAFETAYEGLIEIADVSGRILERRAVQLDKGDQIAEISVPALPPGVYWLRLNNGLHTAVQKFIKP